MLLNSYITNRLLQGFQPFAMTIKGTTPRPGHCPEEEAWQLDTGHRTLGKIRNSNRFRTSRNDGFFLITGRTEVRPTKKGIDCEESTPQRNYRQFFVDVEAVSA